jgi:hypothetical protein
MIRFGTDRSRSVLVENSNPPGTNPPAQARKARAGLRRMPDLLGKVLGREAKRRGLAEARLLTEWQQVIGEAIASRCQPISLSRQGVLLLDVAGSAALELQHAEFQVIERINLFFGHSVVSRLRLRQSPPKRRTLVRKEPPPPPLDPAKAAVIDETVQAVGDEDLKKALASLGQTLGRRANGSRR